MTGFLQSALVAAAPQAAHISWLWWLTFWISTAVFVIVIGPLAAAIAHGRRARIDAGAPRMAGPINEAESAPPLTRTVSIGVALAAVTLLPLLAASMRSAGRLHPPRQQRRDRCIFPFVSVVSIVVIQSSACSQDPQSRSLA